MPCGCGQRSLPTLTPEQIAEQEAIAAQRAERRRARVEEIARRRAAREAMRKEAFAARQEARRLRSR